MPYVKTRQVFNCPSLKVGVNKFVYYDSTDVLTTWNQTLGWGAPGDDDADSVKVMYGYNGLYLGGGQWGSTSFADFAKQQKYPNSTIWYNDGTGAPESDIAAPAATLLLIENNYSPRWGPFGATIESVADAGGILRSTAANGPDTYDTFANRHFDGLNVLFTDGHVKWMQKEKALYTPGGLTDNNMKFYLSTDPDFLWNRF
jgi:prepilin-type processing-associated H-X9-DG protein